MDLARKLKGVASWGSGTAVHVSPSESSEHLCPSNCQGGSSSNLTRCERRDVYTAGGCVREQSPHLQGIMHFYHAGETFKLYLEMGPSEFVSRI